MLGWKIKSLFAYWEILHAFLSRGLPGPDLGLNTGPFPIKKWEKLLKMMYVIPNFLLLHFGESFMKIPTKIVKLQMHDNLQWNVNENMFSFTFYANIHEFLGLWRETRVTNMLQLYITQPWSLINLKWWSSSIRLHLVFPTLTVWMIFSQIQQAPGLDFRKVGKSLLSADLGPSCWQSFVCVDALHPAIINNFSVMLGQSHFPIFLVWTTTEQRIKCLAQRHDSCESQTRDPCKDYQQINTSRYIVRS